MGFNTSHTRFKKTKIALKKNTDAWCYLLYLLHFQSLITTLLWTGYMVGDEDANMEA